MSVISPRSVTELYSSQGVLSDIGVSHPKLVRREYSGTLRCSVLSLEGDATRVTLPRSSKAQGFHVSDPIVALQVRAPTGLVCLEFNVNVNLKLGPASLKRITLCSSRYHPSITATHARLPLTLPKGNVWLLLAINLVWSLREG